MPDYLPTEDGLTKALEKKGAKQLDQQAQVNLLLAYFPLVKLDQAYKVVYEKVLNEKISTKPVEER
jgi:hypothetical protein